MRPTLLALALLLPASFATQADVLVMPESGSAAAVAKPRKGSTMKTVLNQFGAPSKKYATVGGSSAQQPPITRWDYPAFSVFFERTHVVDTVVPGRPPVVQRSDELQSRGGY